MFFGMDIDSLGDLRQHIGPPWSEVVLVATSVLCGAAVGFERERQEKPAGLRTLILICLGSTIFTIGSVALGGIERARIAAQIVTGVGFLGAGSIIQDRSKVKGLTTAASIWATAAVGIIVGSGYAVAGLALSVAILIILSALSRVEDLLGGRCARKTCAVVYLASHGKTRPRIERVIDQANACTFVDNRPRDGQREQLTFEYCSSHREHRSVLAELADLEGVEAIEVAK